MTLTMPTRRPQQLKPGVKVTHRRDPDVIGEVRQPDAFYNTLRLRGVGERQQVLVHWPDAELCTWERAAELTAELSAPEETP